MPLQSTKLPATQDAISLIEGKYEALLAHSELLTAVLANHRIDLSPEFLDRWAPVAKALADGLDTLRCDCGEMGTTQVGEGLQSVWACELCASRLDACVSCGDVRKEQTLVSDIFGGGHCESCYGESRVA
jgi:hypothetical protein